jgi:hypothetical protein
MFNNWTKTAERMEQAEQRKERSRVRAFFGVSNAVPVIESPDVAERTLTGNPGGHFTRGGSPVRFPSAYARKGFSNLVYRCSTYKILVPVNR